MSNASSPSADPPRQLRVVGAVISALQTALMFGMLVFLAAAATGRGWAYLLAGAIALLEFVDWVNARIALRGVADTYATDTFRAAPLSPRDRRVVFLNLISMIAGFIMLVTRLSWYQAAA